MSRRALPMGLGAWTLLLACGDEAKREPPVVQDATPPAPASDASSVDAGATPPLTASDASAQQPITQVDAGGRDAATGPTVQPGPPLVSVSAFGDISCERACADRGQACNDTCVDGTLTNVAGVGLYPMRIGSEVFDVPQYLDDCDDVSLSFDRALRIGLECCCEDITICSDSLDCPPSEVCDSTSGTCVECLQHSDCDAAEHCDDQACVPDVCQPDESRCMGNDVGQCNAVGSGFDTVPCAAGQNCLEAQQQAQCIDWACTPGAIGCDGNDLVECAADGTGELSRVSCGDAGQTCVQSACVTPICEPGTEVCQGGNVFECDSTGTELTRSDTCSSTEYCAEDGDTAICMPQVCEPDTSTCEGQVLSTCNADGSAVASTTTCEADQWCLYGRCRKGVSYSEDFTAGATSQAQCDVWNDFRKELDNIWGILQVRSSAGDVEMECRGSVASTICRGLGYGVPVGPYSCGGNVYEVASSCGTLNAVELLVNQDKCTCTPDPTSLAIRPCNGGTDWGGTTCNPVSQTLEVLCTL